MTYQLPKDVTRCRPSNPCSKVGQCARAKAASVAMGSVADFSLMQTFSGCNYFVSEQDGTRLGRDAVARPSTGPRVHDAVKGL